MRYEYVGPGTAPNSKIFRIVLILFKGDATGPNVAGLDPSYIFSIYNNDNGLKFPGPENGADYANNWKIVQTSAGTPAVPIVMPPCIENAPTLNYTYATYTMEVTLPNTVNGYTAVFQTCCRLSGLENLGSSVGSTYSCSIPGTSKIGTNGDNCPVFGLPVNVICQGSSFTLNFSAVDPDAGDSLVYSFCDAYNGGTATGSPYNDPKAPPYGFVNYSAPYSGGNPFGTGAVINPRTGVITGIAPSFGKYVVCVCLDVYRGNVKIGSHKKDLIVQVSNCNIPEATLTPRPTTCDGFDVHFENETPSALITTYFWDFGVPTLTNDTANTPDFTFTYPAAGDYLVKLVTNRNLPCSDSATVTIKVYPGFRPNLEADGACYLNPFQFRDLTQTDFGVVDTWSWNFGDENTLADTSHVKNPLWTYSAPGTKTVTLNVTNSKGCFDTKTFDVEALDKPLLTLGFKDTLICIPDAVTLDASGTGGFSWTPLVNITGANTGTPTVNPTTSTWYRVSLTDHGCANVDSVHVRVVGHVSLAAMLDTTICRTDGVVLSAQTDGLSFQWSPAATIDHPTLLHPTATPVDEFTPYTITATIGSCSASDVVTVRTVPYPIADAGAPQTICYNASAQMHGSHDGTTFTWTPASYLNNPNSLNPVSSPPRTTAYVLSSYDTKGCPKPGRDTVVITLLPRVRANAGRDTIVIVGQPLQFNGSGGVDYTWSPPTGLSNPRAEDPIGVYGSSIDSVRYKLIVKDANGCADSAFMKVTVFKTKPSIFVPNAFTPNNDGKNDRVYPISVGMQRINFFSVYNRWGQLVFTTTKDRDGWDGTIKGKIQDTNVYVWMVSAVDYLGKSYFLKGTVTLIR